MAKKNTPPPRSYWLRQNELWPQGAGFHYSAHHPFFFVGCIGGADCTSVGKGEAVGASASIKFVLSKKILHNSKTTRTFAALKTHRLMLKVSGSWFNLVIVNQQWLLELDCSGWAARSARSTKSS